MQWGAQAESGEDSTERYNAETAWWEALLSTMHRGTDGFRGESFRKRESLACIKIESVRSITKSTASSGDLCFP